MNSRRFLTKMTVAEVSIYSCIYAFYISQIWSFELTYNDYTECYIDLNNSNSNNNNNKDTTVNAVTATSWIFWQYSLGSTHLYTHLIHGSLDPHESPQPQTPSWLVQPFLHSLRVWRTQAYTQTMLYQVRRKKSPYLALLAMLVLWLIIMWFQCLWCCHYDYNHRERLSLSIYFCSFNICHWCLIVTEYSFSDMLKKLKCGSKLNRRNCDYYWWKVQVCNKYKIHKLCCELLWYWKSAYMLWACFFQFSFFIMIFFSSNLWLTSLFKFFLSPFSPFQRRGNLCG